MKVYYWYRVVIQDVRGVACYKEGDIEGNNTLHCLNKVEKLNKGTWKGLLLCVHLFKMDMETGTIESDPDISWTRAVDGSGARVKQVDWKPPHIEDDIPFAAPDKPDEKTSHCVSWMAHEMGSVFKTGASSFTSTDLKEI